ncbi:MAG: hypothetical protein K2I96_16330 [Lachnospiraceae bacterium]|nr:hypothetical protein [Lachnospiraceae bacterium]
MGDLIQLVRRMGIWRQYIILLLLRSPFDAFRTWMLANLMKSVFVCLETDNSGAFLKLCVVYGLLCAMLFVYNGIIWACLNNLKANSVCIKRVNNTLDE